MKAKQKLIIEQLDRKLSAYKQLPETPQKGWIHVVRTGLKMSLRQLANRLSITAPSVKEMEDREKNGSITIKNLKEAASALNLKLVYCLIPTDGTIDSMIDRQAEQLARKIVLRTANTMKLEDQSVSKARLEKSIKELATEIKNEMPRYLWD
jgi:predicted DNA-binding mobile mystery protein A